MYSILPRSRGAVLGVEVTGKITLDQELELIAKAEKLLKSHDKISVLVVLGDHAGVSFDAAMADIKWIVTHMKQLDKIAIVADSKLLAALVAVDSVFASMAGISEQHFERSEIETAWHWIES